MIDICISLIVRNNPSLTNRWLHFMASKKFNGEIFIADGSDKSQESIVNKYNKKLNIEYVFFPSGENESNYIDRKLFAINRCSKKYHIFADNDDFFSIQGISESEKMMNLDPEIGCCGGSVTFFQQYKTRILSKYLITSKKKIKPYSSSLASERICSFFENVDSNYGYAQNYSLTRVTLLKELISNHSDYLSPDPLIFEMTYNLYLLLKGKSIFHNKNFYFRQVGTSTLTKSLNEEKDNYARLKDSQWINYFNHFVKEIKPSELRNVNLTMHVWMNKQKYIQRNSFYNFLKRSPLLVDLVALLRLVSGYINGRYSRILFKPQEIYKYISKDV